MVPCVAAQKILPDPGGSHKIMKAVPSPVVTDLVQIRRLGDKKREENSRFRKHLKTHDYPDKKFRRAAERIEDEIDCRSCANCCRVAETPITSRDVERISKHMGLRERDFLERYADETTNGLVLRRTETGCVFLDGNDCLIYDHRPHNCADFPHVVRGAGSITFRMWEFIDRACYCPIVYNTLEAFKDEVAFPRSR